MHACVMWTTHISQRKWWCVKRPHCRFFDTNVVQINFYFNWTAIVQMTLQTSNCCSMNTVWQGTLSYMYGQFGTLSYQYNRPWRPRCMWLVVWAPWEVSLFKQHVYPSRNTANHIIWFHGGQLLRHSYLKPNSIHEIDIFYTEDSL